MTESVKVVVSGGRGAQGSQGFQGVTGTQGSQGHQGPASGAQGSQGAQGSGAQGSQGAQGDAGGAQGSQGSQGSQGAQGFQGVQGAQGYQGNTGSQGAQGIQGSQGTQGSTGTQASSVGILTLGTADQDTLPTSGTSYVGFGKVSTTEASVSFAIPFACTLSKMYISTELAPGAGKSWAFTARKNAVDTALTATVSESAVTANDSSNSAAYVAGDLVAIEVIATGTPASNCQAVISFKMVAA